MEGLATYLIDVINNTDEKEISTRRCADIYGYLKRLRNEAQEYIKTSRELLEQGLVNEGLEAYNNAQKSLAKVNEIIKRYNKILKLLDEL